jgi:alpha-L-rhamnosidase
MRDIDRDHRDARLLTKPADAEKYDALASQIRDSYNRHFYHPETGEYANDSQTSMTLTLWLGL